MHPVEEMSERMERLRNGEKVVCKHCNRGTMKPIGDYATSKCFVCDNCGKRINMD